MLCREPALVPLSGPRGSLVSLGTPGCRERPAAFDDDGVIPPGPAIRAAARAPRGEVARFPGGHYQSFLDGVQERAVEAMVSFLRRAVDNTVVCSSATRT